MLAAGDFDRRLTILRHTVGGTNEYGEPVESWVGLATVHASRKDVSDAEKLRAQAVGSILTTRFVVRSSSVTRTITTSDRIQCEGRVYEITGVKEIGRRDGIEITGAAQPQVGG